MLRQSCHNALCRQLLGVPLGHTAQVNTCWIIGVVRARREWQLALVLHEQHPIHLINYYSNLVLRFHYYHHTARSYITSHRGNSRRGPFRGVEATADLWDLQVRPRVECSPPCSGTTICQGQRRGNSRYFLYDTPIPSARGFHA